MLKRLHFGKVTQRFFAFKTLQWLDAPDPKSLDGDHAFASCVDFHLADLKENKYRSEDEFRNEPSTLTVF